MTAESVDMHLNMLRGAVAAYGGSVEVVAVEQVSCWGRELVTVESSAWEKCSAMVCA